MENEKFLQDSKTSIDDLINNNTKITELITILENAERQAWKHFK